MKKTAICCLLLLPFISPPCFSQKPSFLDDAEIGIQVHYGSFLTDVPKADFLKDSYSYFGELFFSRPLYYGGTHPRRLTRWGASLFFGNTGSRQYIGNMAGVYPFLDFYLMGTGKWESRLRGGLGIGFVQKPYDIETNHKNVLIGSTANIFIEALWTQSFQLSSHLKVNAGLSFSHLSNATIKLPNLGLNIPALSVGIRYAVNRAPARTLSRVDTVPHRLRYSLQLTGGVKQSPVVESSLYGTAVLTAEASKQTSLRSVWGAGLALLYDPALGDLYIDPIITKGKTAYATLNLAPFLSYEKVMGRLSIPIQLGMYIKENPMKRFYQNLGLKYHLTDALAVAGFLKTHMGRADFIHAGINYTIK